MKYAEVAAQDIREFEWFTDILKREGVKSYLEIGSKSGGSLGLAAQALPTGSRIVSVDLPTPTTQPQLKQCIADLKLVGYDVHVFFGNSRDPVIKEDVAKLGPFDACFIDANHTLPYVTHDWRYYGQLSRIVAFHDIGWVDRPGREGRLPIEVPLLWEHIKLSYRHEEKKLNPRDNGIGVLWRT